MLKRLLTLALFIGLAIPLHAQGNTVTIPSSGAPSSLACNFNLFVNDATNGNLYFCKSGTLTILGAGTGSGTVSGQASGVIPLGTAATVIGAQSHIDDGVTTPGTLTATEPFALPTGSTAPTQLSSDNSTNLATTAFVKAAAYACSSPGTICASDYGVTGAGAGRVFDALVTNGSANLSSASANFPVGIVGAQVLVTTGPYADSPTAYNSKLVVGSKVTPVTVITRTDSTHLVLSANANANASGTGNAIFTWFPDPSTNTTGLINAFAAADGGNFCETVIVPGGLIVVDDALLVSPPTCTNGLFGSVGTQIDTGMTVGGQGLQGTILFVAPQMNWTDCIGMNYYQTGSNGCFFSIPGLTVQNLFIDGGGFSNTGLSSPVSIIAAANDQHFFNFGIGYLGGNDADVTGIWALGGSYCVQCWMISAGAIGVSAPNTTVVAGFLPGMQFQNSFVADNATHALVVSVNDSFLINRSVFGNSNGGSGVLNQGGIVYASGFSHFMSGVASAGYNSNTSGGLSYLGNSFISNSGTGNGLQITNGIVKVSGGLITASADQAYNISGGSLYLNGTTIPSISNKGITIGGGTVVDGCGNSILSGTPVTYTSGTVFGDCSINGTVQTSGNVALTSGWGTGAAVSAVSGATKFEQFTITTAGAPGANPVLTVTFPVQFWTAPVCTITQTGGTGIALTVPTSGTITSTSAAWTFTGTALTGTTYTFQQACKNPNT